MTSKSIALRNNLITLATLVSPNREHSNDIDTRPQTNTNGSADDDVDVNGSDSRNEDEAVIRYITFWKDGFSFKNWNGNGDEDEELRKYGYEDSDSCVILEKMNKGMAPTKLLDVKDGQLVELLVCKRLDELYPGGLSSKGITKSSESLKVSPTEVKPGFKKGGELGNVKKGGEKVKVGTITSGRTEKGSKAQDSQNSGCILS